ncbi:MAG: hypothetical protein DCC71_14340 [Proteobacteria bacterium]|nr:MAG: hypothetical protein DCC71_14340 [Pseudomonadota bacterium]
MLARSGPSQARVAVESRGLPRELGPAASDEAMFGAIRRARHHVHLETYILASDEMGTRLADLLVERRARGVEIRCGASRSGRPIAETIA